ncbi:MAG: hypothetical protein LQ352_005742 [Teloschistes flavicans]|nr:MAG: hypothetical protein LQ352_005742 [Teloschistes flavicans]
MANPEERTRLSRHFDGPESSYKDRWADLWDAGDFLPWDRGGPNPALIDLLDQRQDLLGDCSVQEAAGIRHRKRALVPGCGRGYDVLLLASHGYDAYGLEVSPKAVQRCLEEKLANGHKYPAKNESAGVGESTFLRGDFFQSNWASDAGGAGSFDLIYDYTVISRFQPITNAELFLRRPRSQPKSVSSFGLIDHLTVFVRSTSNDAPGLGTTDVEPFDQESVSSPNLPRVSDLQEPINWWSPIWSDSLNLRRAPGPSRGGAPLRPKWSCPGGKSRPVKSGWFEKTGPLAAAKDA